MAEYYDSHDVLDALNHISATTSDCREFGEETAKIIIDYAITIAPVLVELLGELALVNIVTGSMFILGRYCSEVSLEFSQIPPEYALPITIGFAKVFKPRLKELLDLSDIESASTLYLEVSNALRTALLKNRLASEPLTDKEALAHQILYFIDEAYLLKPISADAVNLIDSFFRTVIETSSLSFANSNLRLSGSLIDELFGE